MAEQDVLKFQVFKILGRGRHKAVPGHILAKRLGLNDDRQVRRAIRELISDGVPIVSSTAWPHGFFIAETKDEIKQYATSIKSRLVENALHRRDVLRAAQNIVNPEQMRLKL